MDREHRELQQQMQRLDVPDKDSERRGESAEWSQISGRLDAFHSVLANHGARLLEGEAHLQALTEHLGWQGPKWEKEESEGFESSPVFKELKTSIGQIAAGEIQQQLEELQRSQDAMAESLRESKGSVNAALGDMKALWREVARLQQGDVPCAPQLSLSDMQQEVQSLRLMVESHEEELQARPTRAEGHSDLERTLQNCQMEIEKLKKQLHVVESLILAYRDALSDMTGKLKDALDQKQPPSPHFGIELSLAAHARKQASVERAWPPTTQGVKKLMENVLEFVEELHTRVRRVEDVSFAKDIAEVRRQMEVLQGETLMSFHQLQQAVADLNCAVEAGSKVELTQVQELQSRVQRLEVIPGQMEEIRVEATTLQQLSNKVERLEALPDLEKPSVEAKALQDLSSRLERLEAVQEQSGRSIEALPDLEKSSVEAKALQDLSSRLERLEAVQEQSGRSIEAKSSKDLGRRLERVEALAEQLKHPIQAIPEQVEKRGPEAKSLQDLRSRLDRLEVSATVQLDKVQKEEEVHKKLLNRLTSLEASTASTGLIQPRLEGIEARMMERSRDVNDLVSRLERLDRDFARQHARLEDLEQERREGQALEEVLQDKVGRIEHLEAAVKSDAQSLVSFRDEIGRLQFAAEGHEDRVAKVQKQLKALEQWRQEDAQVQLSRFDQRIQTLTEKVSEEVLQSCKPLVSEVSGRVDQLQQLTLLLQTQVSVKPDNQDLERLKSELGRLSSLVERMAEKGEVAEVSRCLQSSIASAQESMNAIKEELLQVQRLAGAQGKDGSPHASKEAQAQPRVSGNPSEPLTWTTPRAVVTDVVRLAEELHQARSAAMHQTRMEVHRAEAMGALESQVAALNLRLEDVFARLNEVELGIDTAGRGGVALRLRFEQMQSSVELRLTSLAADVADVCTRQHAMERGIKNEAREPLQVDIWERCERLRSRRE